MTAWYVVAGARQGTVDITNYLIPFSDFWGRVKYEFIFAAEKKLEFPTHSHTPGHCIPSTIKTKSKEIHTKQSMQFAYYTLYSPLILLSFVTGYCVLRLIKLRF